MNKFIEHRCLTFADIDQEFSFLSSSLCHEACRIYKQTLFFIEVLTTLPVSHSCCLDLVVPSAMWPLWHFESVYLLLAAYSEKQKDFIHFQAPDCSFPTGDMPQLFLLNEFP